jgi:MSHA type pilus biogenesis protein MshL
MLFINNTIYNINDIMHYFLYSIDKLFLYLQNLLKLSILFVFGIFVLSCTSQQTQKPKFTEITPLHIDAKKTKLKQQQEIPTQKIKQKIPTAEVKNEETYTVMVQEVPLKDVLLALAKDADLKLDISSDITGKITLAAKDETLGMILSRIADVHPIRYEIKKGYVKVMSDKEYLRNYNINYVNITREHRSQVSLETQIGAVGFDPKLSKGNNSKSTLDNVSYNNFWQNLNHSIANIIKAKPRAVQVSANNNLSSYQNIFLNPAAGIVSVRATSKEHKKITNLIQHLLQSMHRQVMIEANIIEIELFDNFQAGVDWQRVVPEGEYVQSLTGTNMASSPFSLLKYTADDGKSVGTIRALSEFGNIKVLSTPKITALNNQSAIMKVVDNKVYFTTSVQVVSGDEKSTQTLFETHVHTVPVGFVMQVIAQINDNKDIMINLRPTISRIIGYVNDPNPQLSSADVQSKIPEIQVRELETMLKVKSGQTLVLGGLMQDKTIQKTSGVPLLSKIPYLGALFSYQSNQKIKTELLIFLKTTVVE